MKNYKDMTPAERAAFRKHLVGVKAHLKRLEEND